jgi:hypothetical protein
MKWLQCVILFCKLDHEVFQKVYEFVDIGLRDMFYSLIKVMSLSLTFHIFFLESS